MDARLLGPTFLWIAVCAAALRVGASQPSAQAPEPTPASVWAGVYTEEQIVRGETAYRQECASCHGDGMQGADMAPALAGGVFTANWNDLSVGDLFERIRTTMPLDKPGTLSRQQNADVIAYMLKANGWPAGKTELPREATVLKLIKIEANKPAAQP